MPEEEQQQTPAPKRCTVCNEKMSIWPDRGGSYGKYGNPYKMCSHCRALAWEKIQKDAREYRMFKEEKNETR